MTFKTNCLMCGNELICRKGGKKKKMYCGHAGKVGTCSYKRKLASALKKRVDTKSVTNTSNESLESCLERLGGRTLQDILKDREGRFTLMFNGRNKVYDKVYIPNYVQS